MDARQADDLGPLHVKFGQGGGKRHGLGKAVLGQTARPGRLQRRMQHIGAGGSGCRIPQALPLARGEKIVIVLGVAGDQSSPS